MVDVYHRTASFKGDQTVTKSVLSKGKGGRGGEERRFIRRWAVGFGKGEEPIAYAQLLSGNAIGEELRGRTWGVVSVF